jgi:hypothetical protein
VALAAARNSGVRLSLDGDKIVAEAARVPSSVVGQIKAVRPDIVAILKGRDPARAPFGIERPLDCTELQWDTALLGLHHFIAGGHAERGQALGWSHSELFNVPALWSQVRLTGAGWLIGEWQVTSVTAEEITITPPWSPSSQLKFRRQDDLRQLAMATKCALEALPAAEAGLVADVVSYMADRIEVSALPDRLLTVVGQPVDDDERVLLDRITMLEDALAVCGIDVWLDRASGHVVLGHAWKGCPQFSHTLSSGKAS